MIRLAIVDDIPLIRETLKEKIEVSPDFNVINISENGVEFLKQLRKQPQLDVVLLDIHMPEMNGIETCAILNEKWPHIKVVMCTVFEDDQHLFEAIRAGAAGYLLKDQSPAVLHKAIYEAIEGGAPMSPTIARKAFKLIQSGYQIKSSTGEPVKLTHRELEVLVQLKSGKTYEEIGGNLVISYGTVRKHVENIYKKLKVHNRQEALNKANKLNLL